MNTICITGAFGFIGSHLVEHYLKSGMSVIAVDNLSTGSAKNLAPFMKNPNMTVRFIDVCNKAEMDPLIEQSDIVFHMAAPVGVKYIMDNPIHTLLGNVRGTDVILELCNKYRKVVFIPSSSSVYGKNLDCIPHEDGAKLKEDSYCVFGSTQNHRWAYANTKAFDEFLSFAYYKKYGLPVVCVRFFNVIGPKQTGRYGMVVPSFIRSALKGHPLSVYGDGTQCRCFVSVHDLVRTMTQLVEMPEAYGDLFNFGGPYHMNIIDLAKLVIKMTGSKSEIEFIDFKEAYGDGYEEMMSKEPDVTKLSKILPVEFKYSMEDILNEIIEYERKRL